MSTRLQVAAPPRSSHAFDEPSPRGVDPSVPADRPSSPQAPSGGRARWRAGERACRSPGITFAVKDNIDVAGMPTTAGCLAFAYTPRDGRRGRRSCSTPAQSSSARPTSTSSPPASSARARPYGASATPSTAAGYRAARAGFGGGGRPRPGLDFALAPTPPGSGRVPAAFNGVVGVKPTRGFVSTEGVVPACASFDCVTVFARSVGQAERALAVLTGPVLDDVASVPGPDLFRRLPPPTAPLAPPAVPVVARAHPSALADLGPGYRWSYQQAVERLVAAGCEVVTIGLDLFFEAGSLLYQGGFLAERHAAVGDWMDAHSADVDPVVGSIIAGGRDLSAARLAVDTDRLGHLRAQVAALLGEVGALAPSCPPFRSTRPLPRWPLIRSASTPASACSPPSSTCSICAPWQCHRTRWTSLHAG